MGSLLGGSPNQAKGPPTSVGCSQLLRLAGMCILVPSALVHCLGKSGGSAEPAGTPELGGAVILIVPRHDGPHDLVSLISPAGRIYFPPILWKRKQNKRGDANCPGALAEFGTHIPRGKGLLLTFPARAWLWGGLACPGQPGLALSPHPPPSPGGQLQLLASGQHQTRPGGCDRGAVPPSQDPPESPFLTRL